MSKEIKIGLFGIIIITAVVFGYRFLAGENLFGSSKYYYINVDNAKGLIRSSPIFYKGFQVGTVSNINFKQDDLGTTSVNIELRIDEPVQVKKDAIANIVETGFVGGKAIRLKIDDKSKAPIAPSGSTIKGVPLNIIASMIGSADELSPYTQVLKDGLVSAYDTIAAQAKDPTGPGVGKMFNDMDIILADMKVTMHNLNRLIRASNTHITTVLTDLSAVTTNLKASNSTITSIMANTEDVTRQLKEAGLDSTIIGANVSIAHLQKTLQKSNELISSLNELTVAANKGDGTLAMLMNDPKLKADFALAVKNMNLFMQDFRLNPKRYVNVSVFGKKQKKYEVPENDPAFIKE